MKKRLYKLHEIVDSPEYEGQDFHLPEDSHKAVLTAYTAMRMIEPVI